MKPLFKPTALTAGLLLALAIRLPAATQPAAAPSPQAAQAEVPSPVFPENSTGFSEPVETIDLTTAETGVIEKMEVKEGDAVEPGQFLGRLDSGVLEATLKIAEIKAGSRGAVSSAEARYSLRCSRLQKLEELNASRNANPEELERARSDKQVAEAELEVAREESKTNLLEVDRIKENIARRTLRSPIHGVVTRVLRDVGEGVDARTDHVLTIVNLDQLRIVLHVQPKVALGIKPGQSVLVRPLEGGKESIAQVEFVSPVTEPVSGTVRIKLLLDNREHGYISGMKFRVASPPAPKAPIS